MITSILRCGKRMVGIPQEFNSRNSNNPVKLTLSVQPGKVHSVEVKLNSGMVTNFLPV